MKYAPYCSSVNQCEGVTLTHALCITSLTPLLTCPFIRHTCGFVSFAYFHAPPARTTPPMQRSSETWKLSTCSRLWQKKFFFFFLHQLELGAVAKGFPKRGPRTTHGSPERLPGEHKLEFAGGFFFHPPPLSFLEDCFLIPGFPLQSLQHSNATQPQPATIYPHITIPHDTIFNQLAACEPMSTKQICVRKFWVPVGGVRLSFGNEPFLQRHAAATRMHCKAWKTTDLAQKIITVNC